MSKPANRKVRTHRTREYLETVISKFINPDTPPHAMYDIGVGPKSEYIHLKRKYPEMRLYGCEPNPEVYEQIKPKFDGELMPCAITQRKGPLLLFGVKNDPKNVSLIDTPKMNEILNHETMCWTLDRFDKWAGHPDRIMLWMDIEGSELDAMKSGPEVMSSGRVVWINLEVRDKVNHEDWCTGKQIEDYLTKMGYERVNKYNNHKTHWDEIWVHTNHLRGKVRYD